MDFHEFKATTEAIEAVKMSEETTDEKEEKQKLPDPMPDGPRKKKKIGLRSEDFSVNLGKVIDTLNSDYPLIFVKPLDYSIYIDDIEVTDPTGIAFQGLNTYKSLFTVLRFFAKTVFTGQSINYKIHYDYLDQAVRVIWHV